MTLTIPSIEVAAPQAVPYPFGLLAVPPAAVPAGGRWEAGVWWRSTACNLVGVTYNPCNVETPVPEKPVNVVCGITEGSAFTVFARSDESTGGGSLADKYSAARSVLLAGEQYAAETALWDLIDLASSATVPVVGVSDAERVVTAIATAEAEAAQLYSGTPVLHMNRYWATKAVAAYAARVEGGRLVSALGSRIVAGGGYNVAAYATLKVLATGALNVLRSEVFDLGQHVDRAVNSVSAVVERMYVIGWDCFAITVE